MHFHSHFHLHFSLHLSFFNSSTDSECYYQNNTHYRNILQQICNSLFNVQIQFIFLVFLHVNGQIFELSFSFSSYSYTIPICQNLYEVFHFSHLIGNNHRYHLPIRKPVLSMPFGLIYQHPAYVNEINQQFNFNFNQMHKY